MDALARRAWSGACWFFGALGLCLFLPAGTLRFWQAWLYLIIFCGSVAAITAYFLRYDRSLIERRLAAGPTAEPEPEQRRIQTIASVCLLALYVVAGLERRAHDADVLAPATVVIADAVAIVGFAVIFLAFRANSFAAATIRTQSDQPVIATGPYAVVRHPMYAGAALLFLATPYALDARWAFLPALGLIVSLIARLQHEERYLDATLPDYAAYCRRVRSRLVPGLW